MKKAFIVIAVAALAAVVSFSAVAASPGKAPKEQTGTPAAGAQADSPKPPLLRPGVGATVTGQVSSIAGNTITVALATREVIITVDEQTQYMVPNKNGATLADVAVGSKVAITAAPKGDARVARLVVVLLDDRLQLPLKSVTFSFDENSVTLVGKDGQSFTYYLPEGMALQGMGPLAGHLGLGWLLGPGVTGKAPVPQPPQPPRNGIGPGPRGKMQPRMAPPPQGPAPFFRGPGQARPGHPPAPQKPLPILKGTVSAVDATAGTVTIKRGEQSNTFKVSAEAEVTRNGQKATLAAVQVGDVVISAVRTEDGSGLKRLAVGTQGFARPAIASGTVSALGATDKTVTITSRRGEATIKVTANTRIWKDGKEAKFEDLVANDLVIGASYDPESKEAWSLRVRKPLGPAAPAPKPATTTSATTA